MADSFIQVAPDSTGKQMQTYLNTISAQPVHAEAVVLVDSTGTPLGTTAGALNVYLGSVNASFSGNINAVQTGTWNIGTLTSITNPVTVSQSNPSSLNVTASQGGTWNIGTITTLPANSSFNLSQVGGTATATNSGTLTAGTQRVVIATDQPQLTNALKVDASTVNVPIVNPAGGVIVTNEIPDTTSTYAPTNATSTVYATNLVIKGSAGVLFSITGYSSCASDQFIQIHNAASLPSEAAVPVITFLVRAGRNFSLSFGGKFGRYFSTGIVICNSSTGPTKTIGAADCWFDAQYK